MGRVIGAVIAITLAIGLLAAVLTAVPSPDAECKQRYGPDWHIQRGVQSVFCVGPDGTLRGL